MLNDFQAAFRVSKMRKALIFLLFVLMVVCVWTYFLGVSRWCLLAASGAAAAWAWREPCAVRHLWVDEFYQAWLLLGDETNCLTKNKKISEHQSDNFIQAELLAGSLIHRWGCFLKWRCDGRVFWQVVLPDMLDGDTFRRLRVWAVFGRKQ